MARRRFVFPLSFWLLWLLSACVPAAATAGPTSGSGVTPPAPSETAAMTAQPQSTSTEPPAPTLTPPPASTATATPEPTPPPAAMCSPLDGYSFAELLQIVSNPFLPPRPGKDDGHHGLDFAHYAFGDRTTIAGAGIAAAFPGTVAAAIAASTPYGNFAIVETQPEDLPGWFLELYPPPEGASIYHLYAHLEAPAELEIGEALDCGETFGAVGSTGWSGNHHLHFEFRAGPAGAVFDEMSYYLTTTTVEERANYERWRFGGEFVPLDPYPFFLAAAGNP